MEITLNVNNEAKTCRPGPQKHKCIWCKEIDCTHCQCAGCEGCDHQKGELCMRIRYLCYFIFLFRYKRRLVCNSCEKRKLEESKRYKLERERNKRRRMATRELGIKGLTYETLSSQHLESISNLTPIQQSMFFSILYNSLNQNQRNLSFQQQPQSLQQYIQPNFNNQQPQLPFIPQFSSLSPFQNNNLYQQPLPLPSQDIPIPTIHSYPVKIEAIKMEPFSPDSVIINNMMEDVPFYISSNSAFVKYVKE